MPTTQISEKQSKAATPITEKLPQRFVKKGRNHYGRERENQLNWESDARWRAARGRYAAEDLMEDAAHRVKRDPLRSVALGFAIGLSIGALAVWVATSEARE